MSLPVHLQCHFRSDLSVPKIEAHLIAQLFSIWNFIWNIWRALSIFVRTPVSLPIDVWLPSRSAYSVRPCPFRSAVGISYDHTTFFIFKTLLVSIIVLRSTFGVSFGVPSDRPLVSLQVDRWCPFKSTFGVPSSRPLVSLQFDLTYSFDRPNVFLRST